MSQQPSDQPELPERDAWHPHWRAMYDHCASKPDAVEDHPWGETVFKVGSTTGKIFAFLGVPERPRVTVKPVPDELEGLLALSFVEKAPYIGRYGWVSLKVEDEAALDLALELIDTTYAGLKKRKR